MGLKSSKSFKIFSKSYLKKPVVHCGSIIVSANKILRALNAILGNAIFADVGPYNFYVLIPILKRKGNRIIHKISCKIQSKNFHARVFNSIFRRLKVLRIFASKIHQTFRKTIVNFLRKFYLRMTIENHHLVLGLNMLSLYANLISQIERRKKNLFYYKLLAFNYLNRVKRSYIIIF